MASIRSARLRRIIAGLAGEASNIFTGDPMYLTTTNRIDVQAIEARAHVMRAEFVRDIARGAVHWVRGLFAGPHAAKLT